MILSNRKISARQLNRLILTAGTGTLMLLLPDAAGNSEAGVAALFVAFGITLIHLKIVFWLVKKSGFRKDNSACAESETAADSQNSERKRREAKRRERKTEYKNGDMAVRVIRNLAAVIEFMKCLILSAGLLLAAANTVRTILLPGKSFALVAAVWLAGAVYLACAGTEARGRFAEAVWLIALLPLAFLLLLCLAHIGKHGSITEGALISATTLKNSAAGILLRGILYSAVFAPVELIYWCRDKIAWDVPASRSSKNSNPAETGLVQNDGDGQERTFHQNRGEDSELSMASDLSEADTSKRESGEMRRKSVYRKTERAIMSAVGIVFLFGLLFTAAAVGILGIQGIQATEHSAMAIAAGLDVMGAIVAQKQGIAVLFFLTGMLTASGVLLGQMERYVQMAVEVIAGEKEKRQGKPGQITNNGEKHISRDKNENKGKSPGGDSEKNSNQGSDSEKNSNQGSDSRKNGKQGSANDSSRNREYGRKNHAISLCLALLIWCVAVGLYGRFVNPTSGEQTAESGNHAGAADSIDMAKNSGTSTASLTTTAQIEDRAYCTAIGIDLAEESENMQAHDESDEDMTARNQDAAEENESGEEKSFYIFTIEIAQGSDMKASFVTCEADSLAEAAAIFNANSDRELDVSHLQILLLGNSLLESGTYKNMLLEFGDASEYYFGGTLLAFTSETANEYMESYADIYDSESTAMGLHLKKRFEQGLESKKAVLGTVYYRWINHAEEEPSEWIPTLTLK